MLLFYIWRLRALWSWRRDGRRFLTWSRGWVQAGRLVLDVYGGRGVAVAWRGRVRRMV